MSFVLTAAESRFLHLAKLTICPSTVRSELPTLFSKLGQELQNDTEHHLQIALVPRIPTKQELLPSNSFDDIQSIRKLIAQSVELLEKQQHKHTNETKQQQEQRKVDDGVSSNSIPFGAVNSTYGETPPESMRDLIATIVSYNTNNDTPNKAVNYDTNTNNDTIRFSGDFIDIGSGDGYPTLSAAKTNRFHQCIGIEYNKYRYDNSMSLKIAYDEDTDSSSNDNNSIINFIQDDMCKYKYYNNASIIYANSSVWDAKLIGTLGRILDFESSQMKPPGIVITLGKRLPSPSFHLIDILKLKANNGMFTFYVCQQQQQKTSLANTILLGSDDNNNYYNNKTNYFAVSDASFMRLLLTENAEEDKNIIERLVILSLTLEGKEGMTFLNALSLSESSTRIMLLLKNKKDSPLVLPFLASKVSLHSKDNNTLVQRASSCMVLRAISNFPIGRRYIAENDAVIQALLGSLITLPNAILDSKSQTTTTTANSNSNNKDKITPKNNDHPAIVATIIDIIGQVCYDTIGNEILTTNNIDFVLNNVMSNAKQQKQKDDNGELSSWDNILEACQAAQNVRQWNQ